MDTVSDPYLLHHALRDSARRAPAKTAVVDPDGRRLDYAALLRRSNALAAHLQARGVGRGDRVALYLDNGIEFAVGVHAALLAGAVFMPVNPLTRPEKLAFMLADARAAALLTQASLLPLAEAALATATVPLVMVAGTAPDAERSWIDDGADANPCDPGTIDRDLAAIIYTSGSTGYPKGVMLSHLNMVSAARSISTYLGLLADDVIHCALPLAFDYGLYQLLMAVRCGATVVLERGFSFPVRSLELMARERVTVFPGVPTMFATLLGLKDVGRFDLSSLRLLTNTAAALSETTIRRTRGLFPQARLFSMYGLTECKRVTFLPPEQLDVRPTSVGRGMPNEEVWLVDEEGRRLPNGSVGELVVRGSNVMVGYWERPEETARKLRPGPFPGETILYSGDLFRTDDEGWLYFVARRDDIIKSRGEKVSPREVENAIDALPGVFEVAVVGVEDALLGQAVKAFVVRSPDAELTERDVVAHCRTRLESFMVPKFVEFVTELPKTDTGKIRKAGLARPQDETV